MPLLLIDLDDSLIDRNASFAAWARAFCAEKGREPDVDWLIATDRRGYAERGELFELVRERFGLADSVEELKEAYRAAHPAYVEPPPADALRLLRGLRVVSEIEGVRKPDAAIFRLAAERCGSTLDGAWMAGDNPDADLRGAHALGLRTIWFRLGRTWTEPDFVPTVEVDSLEEALTHLAQLP